MDLTPDLRRGGPQRAAAEPVDDARLGEWALWDAAGSELGQSGAAPFSAAAEERLRPPSSGALERGIFWLLAISLAGHLCLGLLFFASPPPDPKRPQETAVEVIVEPPKPAEKPPAAGPEAKPPNAKASVTKAAEAKPPEPKPPEPQPPEAKAAENKPEQAKPQESRPPENKPAESKPVAKSPEKAAESKPAKPAPSKPAPAKPAELKQAQKAEPKRDTREAAQKEARAAARPAPQQTASRFERPAARGGLALPFDNGPPIFRAVAVPLPTEGGDEPMSYKVIVFGMLERAKHYPEAARARGARGSAVVTFEIDDAGELTQVSLARSSEDAELDVESLALVARAAPFPKPPPDAQRVFAAEISFGIERDEGE